jgi:hypothetical protein
MEEAPSLVTQVRGFELAAVGVATERRIVKNISKVTGRVADANM